MATIPLGNRAVGTTIRISVGGSPRNFVVVHHGRPSMLYDAAFDNATILLQEDVDPNRVWNSPNNNNYQASQIHGYLNGDYLNSIAQNIRDQIRQVRIPFVPVQGPSTTVNSGNNGLSCRVFLLSMLEVGYDNSYSPGNIAADGVRLDWFLAGDGTDARNRRIGRRAGSAANWWLRSPYAANTVIAWSINTGGFGDHWSTSSTSVGVRPALVLPSSLLVSDDGSVITAQPPTLPGAMTVPNPMQGGVATTISWGASTDPQSSPITYIVERSINGGAFSQVFMGAATSFSDTLTFGAANTVAYRVRARNGHELESGWQTSTTVNVVNNVPPPAPASITVPSGIVGGASIVITWPASTSSTSTIASYTLQRSVDNAVTFADVFTGNALSFTDTVPMGTPNVTYRVRATDATGASSPTWQTSPTRTVDNTQPPAINTASPADLGVQGADFAWQYTVTQPDSEVTTVTETLNGQQIRQYTATLGATQTFDVSGLRFMTLLNGPITMTVTATTASNRTATRTITATKGVFSCSVTLQTPLAVVDPITRLVMSVVRFIPSDAPFQVLATNNANDPSPAWEDITASVVAGINYLFTNTTQVNGPAFNFMITASRGPSNVGGFVSTIGGAFE